MTLKHIWGTKDFYKKALIIAIPLMLQQLISTSVNLLDNLMIGQLGDSALAGVTTVNRYFMIATFAINGLVAASAVFIAQFYGANDREHMRQTFRFTVLSASFIMTLFIVIALCFPSTIIGFFINDAVVVSAGLQYIYIASLTFIPNLFTISIAGSMRATGDSKTPLVASVISVLSNAFFNYCLIYGHFGFPQMGIAGAALGTLIARILELLFISYFLKTGPYPFKTSIGNMFHISHKLMKRIIEKALPLVCNEVLWASGMALLLRLYATRGPEVISGYSIATTVSDLFFTMNAGMSIAITILVAQPLGANKFDQARSNGYNLMGFGVMLSVVFGTLLLLSTFGLPLIYSVSDAAMTTAQTFLRIQAPLFIIYVMNTTCYFILRAGGDTRSTLMLDSGYMWLVNLPAVAIATYYTGFGIVGLYLIGQSTDIIKFFLGYRFVKKEKWLTNLANIQETANDIEYDM